MDNKLMKIKNIAIEDSKQQQQLYSLDYEQMFQTVIKKFANKDFIKEKDIEELPSQMVYAANLLLPNDDKFVKEFVDNNEEPRKMMEVYENKIPSWVFSRKALLLQDKIKEYKNKKNTDDIKEKDGMKEITQNYEQNNIEPIELNPNEKNENSNDIKEEISKFLTSIPFTQALVNDNDESMKTVVNEEGAQKQETIEAIANIGILLKKSEKDAIDKENLQRKNDELITENDTLLSDNKLKDKTIDELNNEILKLKQINRDHEEIIENQNKKIESLDSDISSLKKNNNDLQTRIDDKDRTIENLNKNVEDLENRNGKLSSEVEEKNKNYNDIVSENENMKIANDSLLKRIDVLQKSELEKDETIKNLQIVAGDYNKLVAFLNNSLGKDSTKTRL